ncbi:hypothetical protein H2248_000940 [Termitomyces sp. 'cryptogamus']|nr:hypothetical protein H2248_000940 [Termitomyces sp. 'cryptogamus']
MIQVLKTQMNVSIPMTAFNNGAGSFTFRLPFPSGQQFVITMSDALGYGSGGTTNLLTTGASQGGLCNTADPSPVVLFETSQQCRTFVFSNYSGAGQPVTIDVIQPGGQPFSFSPPIGNMSRWDANVTAGTALLFSMVGVKGGLSRVSPLQIVGATDDATCNKTTSPPTTATVTLTPSTAANSQTSSATTSPPEHKISNAAIAGIAVGVLVILVVVVALGLFFLRKRKGNNQRSRNTNLDLTYDPVARTGNHLYPSAGVPPQTLAPGSGYNSTRFTDQPPIQQQASHAPSFPHTPLQYQAQSSYPSQYHQPNPHHQSPLLYQQSSQYQSLQSSLPPSHSQNHSLGSETNSFRPYTPNNNVPSVIHPSEASDTASTTISGTSKRQAAMTDISTHSRFIVHTDVEHELPNQDRIVELPPQYFERPGASAGPFHTDTSYGSEY